MDQRGKNHIGSVRAYANSLWSHARPSSLRPFPLPPSVLIPFFLSPILFAGRTLPSAQTALSRCIHPDRRSTSKSSSTSSRARSSPSSRAYTPPRPTPHPTPPSPSRTPSRRSPRPRRIPSRSRPPRSPSPSLPPRAGRASCTCSDIGASASSRAWGTVCVSRASGGRGARSSTPAPCGGEIHAARARARCRH